MSEKKKYYKLVSSDGDRWYFDTYEEADRTRYIFGGTILEVYGRICPVCGNLYTEHPALSRKDNRTEICPVCGLNEAMTEFFDKEEK